MTAIKHLKDLMQEAPYNLLNTSQRAQKQLSCIHWIHEWSNLISYWTTALWWTWGDIRPGNLAPTDLSYGVKHLPMMSLQHSQWNQSDFMHSATALLWQITLLCHFLLTSNTDVSTTVCPTKWQKISLRKTNKWTKYDSLTCLKMCQFTGTIQKMIISNIMSTEKIMDLQACHDNLTCSPNEWAEQSIIEMKLSMHAAFKITQDISGYENIT